MRFSLRLKLLLLLPLLGLLPWLGLRYVDSINRLVDQSQLQAARLVAEAVASNISSANLPTLPLPDAPRADSGLNTAPRVQALSVYGLRQPLLLDGFFSDWPAHHEAVPFDRLSLRAAQWHDRIFLAIDVDDDSRHYVRPLRGGYDASESRPLQADNDYIELSFAGGARRYRLMAEGPGRFLARPLIQNNRVDAVAAGVAIETAIETVIEPAIEAVWWELADRYQLELALPLSLLGDSAELELLMHDVNSQGLEESRQRVRLLRLRPELQTLLAYYSQIEQQLLVQNAQREVVAISEGLGPKALGRLLQFVDSGLEQQVDAGWSRVRVPINPGDAEAGYVVVQVVSDAVSQVQRKTLFDLGWQTLGVLLAVVAGLLLFASRLAYRIKRLGVALSAQYNSAGRLQRLQPLNDLDASDEVGELARGMDQLLERLERYTQFLERVPRTLRHELSNPLNTISTSLELLLTDPDSGQQQRLIGSAQRGVSKLEKTIQSITEAVSLEDALKQEAVAQIDLNALLQSYTERCQLVYPAYRFEFRSSVQRVQLLGSDLRLEQLLDKLIDNAMDFTPPERRADSPIILRLSATYAGTSAETASIELEVSNCGSIDAAQTEQLFELFSGNRNDGSGNHLGLGLYVVKLIAQAQGGRATIQNREGRVVVRICW